MNSGYSGYSMSNRAVRAYENGEKPLSKWTKTEIISRITEIDKEKGRAFSKVKLSVLKDTVLRYSSWHHTSNRCNRTDFYEISESTIEQMTIEDIHKLAKQEIETVISKLEDETLQMILVYRYIDWMTWSEIAAKVYYSDKTIRRKHDLAIDMLKIDQL
jgi:DNA-directed RNA polymerase specialized sigma subunit